MADRQPSDVEGSIFKIRGKWTKKFLIMRFDRKCTNKTFKDFNPFDVCRVIKSYSPSINIKFLKNGTILLSANLEKDFINLGNIKSYRDTPVLFELHKSLNFSRGVVYVPELLERSEDEIKSELESCGVVRVCRIFKRINNVRKPTPLLVLTFQKSELPDRIVHEFLSVRVRPYEPNPLQCFSCYRYRHTKKNCQIVCCGICGNNSHTTGGCNARAKCVNCLGEHPAYSRKCPMYLREKQIEVLRTQNKISYKQAESIILRNYKVNKITTAPPAPLSLTFSEIVAGKSASLSQSTIPTSPPTSLTQPQSPSHSRVAGISASLSRPTIPTFPSTSLTQPPSPSHSRVKLLMDQVSSLTSVVEKLVGKITVLEAALSSNSAKPNQACECVSLSRNKKQLITPIKKSTERSVVPRKIGDCLQGLPKKLSPANSAVTKINEPINSIGRLSLPVSLPKELPERTKHTGQFVMASNINEVKHNTSQQIHTSQQLTKDVSKHFPPKHSLKRVRSKKRDSVVGAVDEVPLMRLRSRAIQRVQ